MYRKFFQNNWEINVLRPYSPRGDVGNKREKRSSEYIIYNSSATSLPGVLFISARNRGEQRQEMRLGHAPPAVRTLLS